MATFSPQSVYNEHPGALESLGPDFDNIQYPMFGADYSFYANHMSEESTTVVPPTPPAQSPVAHHYQTFPQLPNSDYSRFDFAREATQPPQSPYEDSILPSPASYMGSPLPASPFFGASSSFENSPSHSNSPLIATPESEHFQHALLSGSSSPYPQGRPELSCINTNLLLEPQASHSPHTHSAPQSATQDSSQVYLSPYSAISTAAASHSQSNLHRRHTARQSESDVHAFGIEQAGMGRGRGEIMRVKSAPIASRRAAHSHSPYPATSRLSPEFEEYGSSDVEETELRLFDAATYSEGISASPLSPFAKRYVATPKMVTASRARRMNEAVYFCTEPGCGADFTTNYSRERHMKSHTGQRDKICSVPGCGQAFANDSGRRRHEKSKYHSS